MPLGADKSLIVNFLFVFVLVGAILLALQLVVHLYVPILEWSLRNKWKFLILPMITLIFGLLAFIGFKNVFAFMPNFVKSSSAWTSMTTTFPGVGKEFMPALDEGSFLLMPTTMPHSSVAENMEIIGELDQHLNAIPEVDLAVGKWGRANSALDPSPISMYENIINYLPEYMVDENGRRERFQVNDEEAFVLKDGSTYKYGEDPFKKLSYDQLIVDSDGEYLRQWRPKISKRG